MRIHPEPGINTGFFMENDNSGSVKHCGFVAIVGRPNAGKSTLMNHILGQKVSITSRKPQTTRNRIVGIDTEGDYQTIYVDTPGLHTEEKRAINTLMNRAAESSLRDVELVFFVVDCTRWTPDDEMVLEKLKKITVPVFLVINKIDEVHDKRELLPIIEKLSGLMTFRDVVPVSAKQGTNVDELRRIARSYLPEGEFCFPEDYVTDRSMRFMAAEVIREKLMRFTGQELPYSVAVEIEQYVVKKNGGVSVSAVILVERDGQKKMIIGTGGEKLKTIGTEARKDLEKMLGNKVYLELWVKVRNGWSDDARALRSLGYMDFES